MSKANSKKKRKPGVADRILAPVFWLRRWGIRAVCTGSLVFLGMVGLHAFAANPPDTLYMQQETNRLGQIERRWVPIEEISPFMARSVVAAEDANFCLHWGFDMGAIRLALEEGSGRGASTLSQQVVKNVYLWQGRSWTRKALEALMTPIVEVFWSKSRIVEVYLNVAEFDEGVFGVDAAARHYFGVAPDELTDLQAARLAAVLPNPKQRSASKPSQFVRQRANRIRDGAATIERDGRSACFED
ncbi:MAG: monofunctional biosynthetic peptidoglycan transglycosylase [Pseudomonadota bacterium]